MPIVVGNSLKVTASEVEQLQFLIQNNMQIAGVSVGQCYAQRLSMYSTVFLRPSTLAITGGNFADAFSYASGATVQSFNVAGNIVTTDADTNWPSTSNALPVNMMFVGYSFGVDMSLCSTAGLPLGPLSTMSASDQIGMSCTYKVREGGNLTSNYGLLADYPSGVGISSGGSAVIGNFTNLAAVPTRVDFTSTNGGPLSTKEKFRVPQLWKPLVNYQHRVTIERSTGLTDGTAGIVSENMISGNVIAIRLSWDGYLITAQV